MTWFERILLTMLAMLASLSLSGQENKSNSTARATEKIIIDTDIGDDIDNAFALALAQPGIANRRSDNHLRRYGA